MTLAQMGFHVFWKCLGLALGVLFTVLLSVAVALVVIQPQPVPTVIEATSDFVAPNATLELLVEGKSLGMVLIGDANMVLRFPQTSEPYMWPILVPLATTTHSWLTTFMRMARRPFAGFWSLTHQTEPMGLSWIRQVICGRRSSTRSALACMRIPRRGWKKPISGCRCHLMSALE